MTFALPFFAFKPRPISFPTALALFVLATPALVAGESEPVAPTEEFSPAALDVRGDRLFISARLNGIETGNALLDSGAELSLIDSRFAQKVGLATGGSDTARGTGGTQEVTFAEGVTLEAAGLELEDRTVAVIDLGDLSQRLIGSPVDMIVGRELFDATRLVIDINRGSILPIGRDEAPSGVRLDMQTHKGLQTIPVSVEGDAPVQADFDLGNGSEALIGEAYAERLGLLTPHRIIAQKAGGGIGGELVRDLVQLKYLEIAGVTMPDITAAIDRTDSAADFNVGVRILRNFRMTIDFAENVIWLEPVASP